VETIDNKKSWLKKAGIIGILFFTIKGFIWLLVLFYGIKSC
jgi:DMSO reductase anchor subunit